MAYGSKHADSSPAGALDVGVHSLVLLALGLAVVYNYPVYKLTLNHKDILCQHYNIHSLGTGNFFKPVFLCPPFLFLPTIVSLFCLPKFKGTLRKNIVLCVWTMHSFVCMRLFVRTSNQDCQGNSHVGTSWKLALWLSFSGISSSQSDILFSFIRTFEFFPNWMFSINFHGSSIFPSSYSYNISFLIYFHPSILFLTLRTFLFATWSAQAELAWNITHITFTGIFSWHISPS